ncbi:uncharacterized protein PAC_17255 [Phialocephala subalpina]|uniref:Uncharacterized protein n=1 Tax=Phialocephala subalpina TaxID=576137 RepID=A0A1L7XQM9_9HELO|nr:uncharacterized protein PAC_17255 [Phialocephala subalpina]
MNLLRMGCSDCPRELYAPRPDLTVDDFDVHLNSFLHKTRVEISLNTGARQRHVSSHDVPTAPPAHHIEYPPLGQLPHSPTQNAARIWAKAEVRDLELRPGKKLHSLEKGKYNLEATLAYTRGMETEGPCDTCARIKQPLGPFQKCVVIPDEFNGACTNCRYNNDGSRCYLHRLNVDPTQPPKVNCICSSLTCILFEICVDECLAASAKPQPPRYPREPTKGSKRAARFKERQRGERYDFSNECTHRLMLGNPFRIGMCNFICKNQTITKPIRASGEMHLKPPYPVPYYGIP